MTLGACEVMVSVVDTGVPSPGTVTGDGFTEQVMPGGKDAAAGQAKLTLPV